MVHSEQNLVPKFNFLKSVPTVPFRAPFVLDHFCYLPAWRQPYFPRLCAPSLFPISFVDWPLTSSLFSYRNRWVCFVLLAQNKPTEEPAGLLAAGWLLIVEWVRLRGPQTIRAGKTHGQGPGPRATRRCVQGPHGQMGPSWEESNGRCQFSWAYTWFYFFAYLKSGHFILS